LTRERTKIVRNLDGPARHDQAARAALVVIDVNREINAVKEARKKLGIPTVLPDRYRQRPRITPTSRSRAKRRRDAGD